MIVRDKQGRCDGGTPALVSRADPMLVMLKVLEDNRPFIVSRCGEGRPDNGYAPISGMDPDDVSQAFITDMLRLGVMDRHDGERSLYTFLKSCLWKHVMTMRRNQRRRNMAWHRFEQNAMLSLRVTARATMDKSERRVELTRGLVRIIRRRLPCELGQVVDMMLECGMNMQAVATRMGIDQAEVQARMGLVRREVSQMGLAFR